MPAVFSGQHLPRSCRGTPNLDDDLDTLVLSTPFYHYIRSLYAVLFFILWLVIAAVIVYFNIALV